MRTRFAPSPTGFLHVGGLRTALYSYLLARKNGGTFFLRIEDTDQEREVPGAIENILRSLSWAGIEPQEGVLMEGAKVVQKGQHGPYIQSQRLSLYRDYAHQLLKSGHAYRCFCTPERLEEMRNQQIARKQPPMYDRRCLALSPEESENRAIAGERHVIRMKVSDGEPVSFTDEIRGTVSFHRHTIDDQVLLKGDGFPTYHLAHVVDDHLMETTLVLRGEEWLSSLPKHLLLFEFFGWTPPKYAHVPLLLNADKTKLSKRQNSVAVEEYIAKGYLPEALINFLALLGWNPGTTQEIFSLDELVAAFSLERVQKAGAIFDTKKLDWLQGQWIRKIPVPDFAARIRPLVAEKFPAAGSDDAFAAKAGLIHERITFFTEAPDMMSFFYAEPTITPQVLMNEKQHVSAENLPQFLEAVVEILQDIPEKTWTPADILTAFKAGTEPRKLKLGQLLWPLRAAITGRQYSPGAPEVAAMLGKEKTLERLEAARKMA